MEVRAQAKDTGTSPRKVRLVIDLVRGKKVDEALDTLRFVPSPAAKIVSGAIKSAAANAERNFNLPSADLKISKIFADGAPMMKRYRPRSRGRAGSIHKRSSHLTVIVTEQERYGT
jgi:large subunit ribosomal protein L22